MSGTLEISDEATWMPASWLYDDVLSAMAAGVEDVDPALAERLRGGRTDTSVGYADLSAASGDAYDALLTAVTRLTGDLAGTAAGSGPDRESRRAALSAVGELRALLRTDPRHAETEPATPGSIQVNDTARWDAPRWAFDFVRDHLLGAVPQLRAEPEQDGMLDVRSLDDTSYGQVVGAVDRLVRRYRGEEPSVSWAPRVQQTFTPLVTGLAELLHTDDPRVSCDTPR